MYGSVGAERDAGIPYWIVYVLPRVFPDKLPGRNGKPGMGGYAAFGLPWEEGQELPIGFSTKVVGFKRVANNCASCHTARYRIAPGADPVFVPTGPNHTFDLEAFFRFLIDCAKDPRFNPDTLMTEIELAGDLSWIDRQIYRYVLIPITKRRLIEREGRFAWIYRHGVDNQGKDWPDWGRGRDDAMNLTKYFLTTSPVDETLGPTDMPSLWNLKKYRLAPRVAPAGQAVLNCDPRLFTRMNLAGDTCDANSVIIDSALGLLSKAPPNNDAFYDEVRWLNGYLDNYKAPPFPGTVDAVKAAKGKAVFDAVCARCHADENTKTVTLPNGLVVVPLTGTVVPLADVGTDRERIDSWNMDAAIRANREVKSFGIQRYGLVEEPPRGYVASFLDGIWLRAPYLHNGSVPTLRDLLKPSKANAPAGSPETAYRPEWFYRGYDVYDALNAGFISRGAEAEREGTLYEVKRRSCSNKGHEGPAFGTTLPADDKDALLEYLKTL
jgi:mono/diheme cytochrome c family protein